MTTFSRPRIMGIVNTTPDSFYDGGVHVGTAGAIEHAVRLLGEGADIIDIGGESTRPPGQTYGSGSAAVDETEEIARVIPVVRGVHAERPEALISVDTMKPGVARLAVQAGARMINDVSAGSYDESIWDVVADEGVEYVLMHGHDPFDRKSVDEIVYHDVVEQVHAFLAARIERARASGVSHIIADVGLGFAKSPADSARLLSRHDSFLDLGVPMLVGPSRKAFVGALLGGGAPEARLFGTLGAVVVAAMRGASIVRVHDVAATRQVLSVVARLEEMREERRDGTDRKDVGNKD